MKFRTVINIHNQDDYLLRHAAYDGHLDIVKYLVEKGANVHANMDDAFKSSLKNYHMDVYNYLNSVRKY